MNETPQSQSGAKGSFLKYVIRILPLISLIKIIEVLFAELFVSIGGNTPSYYPDSIFKVTDQVFGLACWWILLIFYRTCRKQNLFAVSRQKGLFPELLFLFWLLFAVGWRGALTLVLLLPFANYAIIAVVIHWIQLSTVGVFVLSMLISIFVATRGK